MASIALLMSPSLLAIFMVVFATFYSEATGAGVMMTLPRVEPELPDGGQRGFLSDLVAALRDATWPGDGGSVSSDAGRRLIETNEASLNRTIVNRSPTITVVNGAVLRATNVTSGLAISQPLASLDACLIWPRRPSKTSGVGRSGTYFLTVFHSSVWSLLLLCLLCSVALLTLLESANPIGMPRDLAQRRRQRSKPMGPFHVLAFATGALLLFGYPRGPSGTSGRVFALFWWFFAFLIAVAYLSGTLLAFLTTRSQAVSSDAALAEVLPASRTILCSAGSTVCEQWTRPELLVGANFTSVDSDSAGLDQLSSSGGGALMLLTHQFACANLLAIDLNRRFSMAVVSKATAWISIVGPEYLVRQAEPYILNQLGSGTLARLARQHRVDKLETPPKSDSSVGEWLAELRLGLPYRTDAMYGPLILLIVGFGLALCSAACEFCYYRFFADKEEIKRKEEELDRKERALTLASTMDTYL